MSIDTPDRGAWPPRPDDEDGTGEEEVAEQERSDALPSEERPGFTDPGRDNPEDPGDPVADPRP
ncbi:MAG TPA: hypothetical protein VGF17_01320 [Phytomonospora sp.]